MSQEEREDDSQNREEYEVMAACGSKSPRTPKIHFLPGQDPSAEFKFGSKPIKHALVAFRDGQEPQLTLSYVRPSDGRYKSLCSAPSPLHNSRILAPELARVLYKLGHRVEWIEANFDRITAHEQLELQRELPREFWPKTWLDEESARR